MMPFSVLTLTHTHKQLVLFLFFSNDIGSVDIQFHYSTRHDSQEIEQQAREAREAANNKRKIAKEKKDDACKTKWGGKILCFRSPTIGY